MSAWKPRYCRTCGAPIKRKRGKKDAGKYCSKKCYFDAVRAGVQQFKGRAHDGWAALADWLTSNSWRKPPEHGRHPTYKPRPPCEVCANETSHRLGRFCSYKCLKAWRGDRPCKCGEIVRNATAYGAAPFCKACKRESLRQQRQMYRGHRRRCRTYGGHFNPEVKPKAVFARDKWRCHVCGIKTSKVFMIDDPKSATIDHHPIPLSKGGDHDWHNVRCACFKCNTLKGNKWDGQRRLALA